MKKKEAEIIAPEKSQYLMETIEQFLGVDNSNSIIDISYYKDKGMREAMCSFEIYGPMGIEDHLNSGVTLQQCDVLNHQILQDVLDNYLESDTIQVNNFEDIHVSFPTPRMRNHHGITISNRLNNSKVSLNFEARGTDFGAVVEAYKNRILEYQEKNTHHHHK